MKMVVVDWTCLCCVDGDIAKVKTAWLSLLCTAQYVMIDKDAKNELGELVLGTTPYGVIFWKMQRHTCGHLQCWLSRARLGRNRRTHFGI